MPVGITPEALTAVVDGVHGVGATMGVQIFGLEAATGVAGASGTS